MSNRNNDAALQREPFYPPGLSSRDLHDLGTVDLTAKELAEIIEDDEERQFDEALVGRH